MKHVKTFTPPPKGRILKVRIEQREREREEYYLKERKKKVTQLGSPVIGT